MKYLLLAALKFPSTKRGFSFPTFRQPPASKQPRQSPPATACVIELERGCDAWCPGDQPFDDGEAASGVSISYTIGKYDFEAHFSENEGTQTNLQTGKVRRLKRLKPGERPPNWEAIDFDFHKICLGN